MNRKNESDSPEAETLSFEQALSQLEQIVQQLEDGRVGLGEALDRYEQGVKYLKYCHGMLQQAERKIALLCGIDPQGEPLTECLDEQAMSLEEKADNRSRRRRQPQRDRPSGGAAARGDTWNGPEHMDPPGGLF